MNINMLASGGLFVFFHIWIVGYTIYYRKRIPCMTGMMAAMTLGMTSGLGIGSILGMIFKDYFFQVTVIGMLIGGLTGLITGMAISLMSVLDGFLSGLMSGMMGAMLGVMLPEEYMNTMFKILALFISTSFFILFLILRSEINTKAVQLKNYFFEKPIIIFLFVIFFLFAVHNTQIPVYSMNSDHHSAHYEHSKNKTSLKPVETLYVKSEDYRFNQRSYTMDKNEPVAIILENNGNVEHDFEIVNTDLLHAQPKQTGKITAIIPRPGIYQAVCTIPGHKEKGMVATIRVI